MTEPMAFQKRAFELSQKLESRAHACPGLYPVRKREDFLRIATDRLPAERHSAALDDFSRDELVELCVWLEKMLHHPETSVQINALSRIRRGEAGPFAPASSSKDKVKSPKIATIL